MQILLVLVIFRLSRNVFAVKIVNVLRNVRILVNIAFLVRFVHAVIKVFDVPRIILHFELLHLYFSYQINILIEIKSLNAAWIDKLLNPLIQNRFTLTYLVIYNYIAALRRHNTLKYLVYWLQYQPVNVQSLEKTQIIW